MSLKAFHIFFISVAVVFCIGLGIWCLNRGGYLALGIGSLLAETIAKTAANDGMKLSLAISYGGRQELADAAKRHPGQAGA